MVDQLAIIAMCVSVALMIGITIVCVLKYRKKEFAVSALLWGIAAFFVYNAVGNILNSTLVGVVFSSQEAYTKFIEQSTVPAALYTSVVATIAFIASATVVTFIQRKRGKTNKDTGEITGTSAALFSWINPMQGSLFYFVNMVMYSFAINAGESIADVSESVTQEQIDRVVASIIETPAATYIVLVLMYITLLLMYRLAFKMIDAAFEGTQKVALNVAVAAGIFFVAYLALQFLTLNAIPSIVSILGVLVLGVIIFYVTDKPTFKKG